MNLKTVKQFFNDNYQRIEKAELNLVLEDENKNLLIDIRDIRELWKSGTVKGARHIPRGMLEFWLDPESPYFKSDLKVEMVKILYCASNWRSALASKL